MVFNKYFFIGLALVLVGVSISGILIAQNGIVPKVSLLETFAGGGGKTRVSEPCLILTCTDKFCDYKFGPVVGGKTSRTGLLAIKGDNFYFKNTGITKVKSIYENPVLAELESLGFDIDVGRCKKKTPSCQPLFSNSPYTNASDLGPAWFDFFSS